MYDYVTLLEWHMHPLCSDGAYSFCLHFTPTTALQDFYSQVPHSYFIKKSFKTSMFTKKKNIETTASPSQIQKLSTSVPIRIAHPGDKP